MKLEEIARELGLSELTPEVTGNGDADSIRRTLRDNADAMTRNDLRAETGIRDGSRMTKALDLLRGLGLVTVTHGAANRNGGPLLPAALSGDDSAELRGDVTAAFGGDAAI